MKKVLIFLLVVGVLILGTFPLVGELFENCAQKYFELLENENSIDDGEAPCGGEGTDGPPVPG